MSRSRTTRARSAWTPSRRRSAISTRKRSRNSGRCRRLPRTRRRNNEPRRLDIDDHRSTPRRMRRAEPPGFAQLDGRAGQGRARQARPVAADQAVRAVRLCGLRPARSVQAPQDRAGERHGGHEQAGTRPQSPQGAARGIPARRSVDGRHARERQDTLRARENARARHLPGPSGQPYGAELRRRRRHQRHGHQAQGIDAGRRRRLVRAVQHTEPAAGRSDTGAEKMNANRVAQRQGLGGLAICRAWIARLAGFAVLLTAGLALAQAPNSIEQVTVTRGAAGFTVVRFTLKAPPTNPPAGFAITSPPRIALDFLDTSSALPNNQRAVDDPALRSLQFVQAGNRTRVVFNLNKPQTFDAKIEGNDVLVTLADSSTATAQAAPAPAQRFAEARGADQ